VAQPVYSTRFILAGPTIGTYRWAVPAGNRAVIRFIAHANYAAATVGCSCKIAGRPFFYSELPGSSYNRFADVRGVAYSGEEVEVVLDHENTYAHVSGFLFAAGGAQLEQPAEFDPEISPPMPDPFKRTD